jgi:nitrate reductase gamma subunit
MRIVLPFAVVVGLAVVGFIGWRVEPLNFLFGVIVPYVAVAVFLMGFIYRLYYWARSPVPFRIPTTAGQEKSLPWVKANSIDNPSSTMGVIARMALEVLAFRSLFRNTSSKVDEGPRFTYASSKWLWGAGLLFHWSFLVIVLRHFRLFVEPVPAFVSGIEALDGFVQLTLPTFYLTDLLIVAAGTYLFIRRVVLPQVKYISLVNDYFPLFLILGIAVSGILLRYITKTDIVSVKAMIQGIVRFSPDPEVFKNVGFMFFVHLFLVSSLLAYFPFSKLMHMGGVFMSPTRNLSNNSRMKRHINPWNPDVKFHTYAEYEDDFRQVMKSVDLPLDKDIEEEPEKKEEGNG